MRDTSIITMIDETSKKVKFFRIDNSQLKSMKTTFITEVSLEHLTSIPLDEACRITGENLFLFMESTRKLLFEK